MPQFGSERPCEYGERFLRVRPHQAPAGGKSCSGPGAGEGATLPTRAARSRPCTRCVHSLLPTPPWMPHLEPHPSPDTPSLQICCLAPAPRARAPPIPPTIAAVTAVAHRAEPKSAVGPVVVIGLSRTRVARVGPGRGVLALPRSSWPEPLVRRSGSNVTRCVCWRRLALRRRWILCVGDIKLT